MLKPRFVVFINQGLTVAEGSDFAHLFQSCDLLKLAPPCPMSLGPCEDKIEEKLVLEKTYKL